MSQKHRKKSRKQEQSLGPASKRLWTIGILLLVAATGIAGIAWWPREGPRTETQSASAPLSVEPTTDTSPVKPAASAEPARDTATAVAKPELRKLKGRWRRSGEQYILEVRDVDESGKVDAAYFNPKPIRVGRAMAKQEAGAATLFVELRDTGYPGCTYTLVYDPKSDQLAGIYYQAAMQEQYEVFFERIN